MTQEFVQMNETRTYIPEPIFLEMCEKCGLKADRAPYVETIRAVFLPHTMEMYPIDFQVLVLANERRSSVRIVYGCNDIPQVAAFDYRCKLPVNLSVQSTDFFYSWAEAHANVD
jgi:hypothetical protein